MDGQRTYPDDEPRWQDGGYGEPRWRDDPYRVPEPRGADPSPAAAALDGYGLTEPDWAQERQPAPAPWSAEAPPPEPGPPTEVPTGQMPPVRRPAATTAAVGDGVYRTRRPAVALLYAALTVLFELGAVRVFLDGMFTGPLLPASVIAGTFLVAGLPIFAIGLYGATTGGVRADAPGAAWLRPPAVYLVAGLGLLLAAGLAAP